MEHVLQIENSKPKQKKNRERNTHQQKITQMKPPNICLNDRCCVHKLFQIRRCIEQYIILSLGLNFLSTSFRKEKMTAR